MKNRKRYINFISKRRMYLKHGFFSPIPCEKCGNASIFHYDRYDAKCCLHCNEWISPRCGSPRCPYCADRPETPLEGLFLEPPRPDAMERKMWRRKNYQHMESGRLRKLKRHKFDDV